MYQTANTFLQTQTSCEPSKLDKQKEGFWWRSIARGHNSVHTNFSIFHEK